MAPLTYNLNEQGKSDPISQILPQVLHWLHCWLLLQLGVHPGHVGLQLLLETENKMFALQGQSQGSCFSL